MGLFQTWFLRCSCDSCHLFLSDVYTLSSLLLQINPEKAREEFRSKSQDNGGSGVKDFMDSMGLGMLADQVNWLFFCCFFLIAFFSRSQFLWHPLAAFLIFIFILSFVGETP